MPKPALRESSPLPIDAHVPRIVELLRRAGSVVVVAEPGAGKTTRVPPALAGFGAVALLQPRRVAARALARRIAHEQGMVLGDEIGWHVRGERRFGPAARLIVMTEGILTARLQSDPLLGSHAVIVLDEFHERSLHGDLALALARQAQLARGDLKLVVMSATLDPGPVSAFLGDAPIVTVPGRTHPVEIEHGEIPPQDAVRRILARPGGDVLVFLPGMAEIRRTQEALAGVDAEILPLHGTLSADEQDRALAPFTRRKVVLATNVAETSLTVDGITDVVDSGEARILRSDPATGLDRLAIERIPRSSADQRAGRAGRTSPGRALRLWDQRLVLRPFLEPEIARVDLASPFLDVLAWGADPLEFAWFERPPEEAARAAMELLSRLGAVEGRRLTALGRTLHRFPLPPRLARVLLAEGGSPRAALACALLAERLPRRTASPPTTDSDVLCLADDPSRLSPSVRAAAREIQALAERLLPRGGAEEPDPGGLRDDDRMRRALLAGFPDRVARRREPRSPRLLLASGTGAVLGEESGVREPEWLLALDVQLTSRGGEAIVRVASGIERAWIAPEAAEIVHRFDEASSSVKAARVERVGALVLSEQPAPPDPAEALPLLREALRRRGVSDEDEEWLRRARFAGIDVDAGALAEAACAGRVALPQGPLAQGAGGGTREAVDRLAPERIRVPSGRLLRLEYRPDGSVVLPVRLQELFGLAETPRIGPRHEPVLLELLSPAGRPVQSTRDLASFWKRTYPDVRKELKIRYPRHSWPEDPLAAPPTHRASPRPPRRR